MGRSFDDLCKQIRQINPFLSICFSPESGPATLQPVGWESQQMPKNVAQVTGLLVTVIIAFGTDMDVFYALPLGMMSGVLASVFAAAAEYGLNPKRS